MKKTFLMLGAAAILVLGACSKKEQAAEAAAAEQEAHAAEVLTGQSDTPAVADLTDDNAWRPGKKVEKLTVLDFNATWCGPCKQLKPVFDQAAEIFPGVEFISVDIDRNHQTATEFGIEAVPTVIFIKPDGTTEKFVGTEDLLPADKFNAIVTRLSGK